MKLTGRCNCGALEYEVEDGGVVGISDCTCRDCQRTIGALSVPFIAVDPRRFRVVKGEGTQYKAPNGEFCDKWGRWLFCQTCGTTIAWMDDLNTDYTLLAGTINEIDEIDKIPQRVFE